MRRGPLFALLLVLLLVALNVESSSRWDTTRGGWVGANQTVITDWSNLSAWDVRIGNGTQLAAADSLEIWKDNQDQTSDAYIATRDSAPAERNMSWDLFWAYDTAGGYTHEIHVYDTMAYIRLVPGNGMRVHGVVDSSWISVPYNQSVHFQVVLTVNYFSVEISYGNTTAEANVTAAIGGPANFSVLAAGASSGTGFPFRFSLDNLTWGREGWHVADLSRGVGDVWGVAQLNYSGPVITFLEANNTSYGVMTNGANLSWLNETNITLRFHLTSSLAIVFSWSVEFWPAPDPGNETNQTNGTGNNTTVDPPDTDGDGVNDTADAFPLDPYEWADTDHDGVGDNTDDCDDEPGTSTIDRTACSDLDGDGWSDQGDACPSIPSGDLNGCPDADHDGFWDDIDLCPLEPGLDQGCPEEVNNTNGTNGTNNTNNTNPNGTGNETNNTGGNHTIDNGTNVTDPTNHTDTNTSVDGNETVPGAHGVTPSKGLELPWQLAVGTLVVLFGAGLVAVSTKRRTKESPWAAGVDLPAHPTLDARYKELDPATLTLEAYQEFAEEANSREENQDYVPEWDMPESYEDSLARIKASAQPIVSQENSALYDELVQLEKDLRTDRHNGEIAPRRYDLLMRDLKELKGGLENLRPLFS